MGSTTEEHALPTEHLAADGIATTHKESTAYRNARMWVQIDGAAHELKEAIGELKAWATSKLKNKAHPPSEGPSPDFNPGDELMHDLLRAIVNLQRARGPQNGDSEPGTQWPTVLSAVGIMITLLGVGAAVVSNISSLNTKVDSVQQAQAVEIHERATQRAEMLELLRQQNDRINRLEDRDRRGYPSTP
jgi:hypothetical protein